MYLLMITSPPIGGGRGIVMPMSVCLFVCLCVCLCVCLFVCLFVRVFAKFLGHISGTNGRRDSGLVSKCRGI